MTQTAIALLLDVTGRPDWQVAAACQIHPSVISHYRLGHRRPHQRHAEALAEYFGCPVATVMGPPEGVTVPVLEQTPQDVIDIEDEWIS